MVEKWTAADEKLFLELEQRRNEVLDRQRNVLLSAMSKAYERDSFGETLTGMIDNAVAIHAALEPFVLSAGGNDNG